MSKTTSKSEMTFWDHLEELRSTLFRCIVVLALVMVLVMCLKSFVFDKIILAPSRSDFFVYRWLGIPFSLSLVNIELSAQFFIHLKTSLGLSLVLVFPVLCYEIWRFISPALYENEKAALRKAFGFASLLFYVGVLVGYCFVLPVTLNFFGTYTVSESVSNTISLQSYISMFMSMVLLMGVVFEFPAVIAVLSNLGLVTREGMKQYRRHAVVGILILAALITPADPFSMLVAALPLYLLYELSVLVCARKDCQEDDISQ